jgi:uncharacterized protein (DUF488 family)
LDAKRGMSRTVCDRTFFTIGYQCHTVSSIISILHANHVDVLIDVRQNPVSRKPGFSKNSLSTKVNLSGIDYVHFPCLGTPPSIRRLYCQSGKIELALKQYEKYLESKTACLQSLVDSVSGRRCCLLCLESCYTDCHRSVIAQQLSRIAKWTAVHLT